MAEGSRLQQVEKTLPGPHDASQTTGAEQRSLADSSIDDLRQMRVSIHHEAIDTHHREVKQHYEYLHLGSVGQDTNQDPAWMAPLPYLHRGPHAYREVRDATNRQLTLMPTLGAYEVMYDRIKRKLEETIRIGLSAAPTNIRTDAERIKEEILESPIFQFQPFLSQTDWRLESESIRKAYDLQAILDGYVAGSAGRSKIRSDMQWVINAAHHYRSRYFGFVNLHESIEPDIADRHSRPGIVSVTYTINAAPTKSSWGVRCSHGWSHFRNTTYGALVGRYRSRTDVAFPWYGFTANIGMKTGEGVRLKKAKISSYPAAGTMVEPKANPVLRFLQRHQILVGRLDKQKKKQLQDHFSPKNRARMTKTECSVEANFHRADIEDLRRNSNLTGIGVRIFSREHRAAFWLSWTPFILAIVAGIHEAWAQTLLTVAAATSIPYGFYALPKPLLRTGAFVRYLAALVAWPFRTQIAEFLAGKWSFIRDAMREGLSLLFT